MVTKGAVMHLLPWVSQKIQRFVRATPTAEIIEAGEDLMRSFPLKITLSVIWQVRVRLEKLHDSKN